MAAGFPRWVRLVALIAVAIPAINIGFILIVLFYLWPDARGRGPTPRIVRLIWRAAVHLRPWSMLDVFLLAAVVAYTRLGQLADTAVGVGGYALAAFVVVQVLIDQMLGRDRVWNAIDDPVKYSPPPGAPSILCLDCDLVVAARTEDGGARRRCPRCGARLAPRRPGSLATTAAFSIAGSDSLFSRQPLPGAVDHPLRSYRGVYDYGRGSRPRHSRPLAAGVAGAPRLDHRAGAEARQSRLVSGRDPDGAHRGCCASERCSTALSDTSGDGRTSTCSWSR